MIKRSALPQQVVAKTISETKKITTLAGKVQAQEVVTLRDLRLPEFDKNRRTSQQKALVFDNDKVAILHMDRPWNASELLMFIGNFKSYRNMWPSHAHILKPLTDHAGLKKRAPIPWTDEMQQAFDKMHALMAADALTAYPDHNTRFDIYTDASDFQLGACIVQEGRPVAYFSYKLSKSQQNITIMEKEMLDIVATLEEF
jgi:hypothetical protein